MFFFIRDVFFLFCFPKVRCVLICFRVAHTFLESQRANRPYMCCVATWDEMREQLNGATMREMTAAKAIIFDQPPGDLHDGLTLLFRVTASPTSTSSSMRSARMPSCAAHCCHRTTLPSAEQPANDRPPRFRTRRYPSVASVTAWCRSRCRRCSQRAFH